MGGAFAYNRLPAIDDILSFRIVFAWDNKRPANSQPAT